MNLSACGLPKVPVSSQSAVYQIPPQRYVVPCGSILQPAGRSDSVPLSFSLPPNDTVTLHMSPSDNILRLYFNECLEDSTLGPLTGELELTKTLDT